MELQSYPGAEPVCALSCKPASFLIARLHQLCFVGSFFFPSAQGLMKLFLCSEMIPQVDVLKAAAFPVLKQFGIDGESLELKVRM